MTTREHLEEKVKELTRALRERCDAVDVLLDPPKDRALAAAARYLIETNGIHARAILRKGDE